MLYNSPQLDDGDEKVIADRIFEILSKPEPVLKASGPAAADLSGQWDVQSKFYAGIVEQTFMIEQKDDTMQGELSVGEYGNGTWTAKRHVFKMR